MEAKAFIFAVLTSLIWGMAPVFEKLGLSGRIEPFTAVVLRSVPVFFIGAFALVAIGRHRELLNVDMKSAIFVVTGGLLAGFAGQMTYYTALKAGKASMVVPIAATYPLIALILSVLFLGESMNATRILGAALVVLGVFFLK